ncbi:TonB-dependent receptor [Ichthyenterobacterium magnum]|uniref:TonB-dependent receptor n=1 Tax=Ichthyenterobacterium magnum TaxID=1230530 RepID=A0A420DXI4_9FLAO|nr:TonB-dependent receptor [Ichthyenterobacterium magnum]RKE98923.1 TonB-dependent receptor [Ichthyenterobacterium magnum]
MRLFTLLFLLVTSTISFAQNAGSISGKLTDKEYNNEPLAFANVLIKGTTTGVTSDFDGLYLFEELKPGTYTIVFSFVGYETQEIITEVTGGKNTELNVIMSASAASLDEVVITTTTKRESEVALLLDQKKATEIKQSIGAEELSRKGVSNAAGAVAKISGVSKQEGSSNVYVRGLGDRYLNTTLNGLALPSNDVNKKNIDLNLFASDIIENVSISKAYASRFYGDFAAGNVDVSSKDYKGKGFFNSFIGSSINTNAADKTFIKSEGTSYFGYYNRYDNNPFAVVLSHGFDPVELNTPIAIDFGGSFGKSFNFENGSKLSFYATGSFGNTFEYRKGEATDYTNVEKKSFEVSEEFEYGTKTTAMAVVNYKLDSNNSFKFNSLFINNSSDVVGRFGIDGKGRSRDAIANTDEGFYQIEVKFNQNLTYVNQFLGKHNYDKWIVDWGIGYNLVNAHEPDRKRITLEKYQFALDNDSTTNPTFYSNVAFDNQRYFQNIKDSELNGRLNIAYKVLENFKLNFGYNGRAKERSFDNIRYGYDLVNSNIEVENINDFNNIFSLNNLNTSSNQNGLYEIKVINSIPGQTNTNRPGLPENTYNGQLDIYAGYFNAEIKADNNKWLIVPGVRLESIKQTIDYNVINLGNSGVDSNSSSETIALPSLSVKYGLTKAQNLRFSASQTISLPEFKEVAPFVYESISQRIGGNPDLLGTKAGINYTNVKDVSYSKILNLDLKYEWFISKSELLSFGVFYKQIKDPVNQVVAFDATGTQRYFRTGDEARILGFEAEIRKNFILDEDDKAKLSGGLNFTYMHTEQDLYKNISGTYSVSFRNEKEKLQGASPILINADINYSPTFGNYKPTANLVFSYFSDRIDALGSGQLQNVIEKGIPTLDFILKNKLSKNIDLDFGIKNILNPTIKYVRNTAVGEVIVTSPNAKGVSNYKRGIDIGFQLKYKF